MGKRACPKGEATTSMPIYRNKQVESPAGFGQSGVVGGVDVPLPGAEKKKPLGESTKMAHVKHGEGRQLPEPPVKVAVVQICRWSYTEGY